MQQFCEVSQKSMRLPDAITKLHKKFNKHERMMNAIGALLQDQDNYFSTLPYHVVQYAIRPMVNIPDPRQEYRADIFNESIEIYNQWIANHGKLTNGSIAFNKSGMHIVRSSSISRNILPQPNTVIYVKEGQIDRDKTIIYIDTDSEDSGHSPFAKKSAATINTHRGMIKTNILLPQLVENADEYIGKHYLLPCGLILFAIYSRVIVNGNHPRPRHILANVRRPEKIKQIPVYPINFSSGNILVNDYGRSQQYNITQKQYWFSRLSSHRLECYAE